MTIRAKIILANIVVFGIILIAAAVVLMPPPQDPGDAPMNMSTIIMVRVASFSEPISTVLNPTVRQVTD